MENFQFCEPWRNLRRKRRSVCVHINGGVTTFASLLIYWNMWYCCFWLWDMKMFRWNKRATIHNMLEYTFIGGSNIISKICFTVHALVNLIPYPKSLHLLIYEPYFLTLSLYLFCSIFTVPLQKKFNLLPFNCYFY